MNLTAYIRPKLKTINAIEAWREKQPRDWRRDHLGASILGRECTRQLWLSFRWVIAPEHDGRLLRLFERGQLEEDRFVAELRGIGCTVLDVDPATGRQFRVEWADRHCGGSADGVVLGLPDAPKTWHLVEMKTHNRKSFDALEKNGVEKSKPEHLAQMVIYMRLLRLDRALYIAACKDTDRLYGERIKADHDAAQRLIDRGARIVEAKRLPPKISENPKAPACRFCDFADFCHLGKRSHVETNCRTCRHGRSAHDGLWWCDRHDAPLDREAQRHGCADYEIHDDLG